MTRSVKVTLAVGAVVLALVAAGFLMWRSTADDRAARARVERIAAAMAAGGVENADFHALGQADPARDYAELVRGMGELRPAVAIADLTSEPGGDAQTATLTLTWTLQPGAPPWSYDVTLDLSRYGDEWRAAWAPTLAHPDLHAGERLRLRRLRPERGEILGQRDIQLAWNQSAVRVGLDKTLADLPDVLASARTVAATLGLDADALVRRVEATGPRGYVEAGVLRTQDEVQSALVPKLRDLPGVRFTETTYPLSPYSSFARPILGVVGEATAEQIEAGRGVVVAGDLVGQAGLQQAREADLRGTAGYTVEAVLTSTGAARDLHRVDAVAGADVRTTLDAGLQTRAERALAGVEQAAAIVAIRPSDGHVLVAASGPGSRGYSTATLGQYPPGSTFKTVSTLAILRAGQSATSTVDCPATVTVDGMRFGNYDGYPASATGRVPLRTAFAHSCNTAFVNERGRVSQADLASAAEALGLTAPAALGVPGFLGTVPAEAGTTEHAASMFGQGKVVASPLGMATVAATIARGEVVRPVLVPDADRAAPAAPARPLTAAEQAQLKALMGAVVTEGGGGVLRGTPGGTVLAKTGTATYATGKYHAWMIAIQGDLAVAVLVEDGESGAKTAGPVLRAFLTAAAQR